MTTAPIYSCKFCNFTSNWETILESHLESKHPTVKEVIDNAAIVKKYNGRCPKCSKTFANKYYLPSHMSKCLGETNELSCPYCDKTFSSLSSKAHHKNRCKALNEHNKYIEANPVSDPGPGPSTSGVNIIDINIKENLEKEVINRITVSVEERIQNKLDDWIQKIKQDSINEIIEAISLERKKFHNE